jgi:hypothetical protein
LLALIDQGPAQLNANTGTGSSSTAAKAPPTARCQRGRGRLAGSARRVTASRRRLIADR